MTPRSRNRVMNVLTIRLRVLARERPALGRRQRLMSHVRRALAHVVCRDLAVLATTCLQLAAGEIEALDVETRREELLRAATRLSRTDPVPGLEMLRGSPVTPATAITLARAAAHVLTKLEGLTPRTAWLQRLVYQPTA